MKRTLALLVAWTAAMPAPSDSPIRGFSPEAAVSQRALEEKARAIPDPVKLRGYMERMTRDTHIAGSPQSKAVAEYALGLLKSWGLDAQIEEAEALMPYPTTRALELIEPVRYKAKLQEPLLKEDKASRDPKQIPTFNSYSASGDVTAQVIYVNYGVPEDYAELKKLGIDPKGKIALARYGKSWRGTKAKVAQENGAVGCLIYSDPKEDGYYQGDIYPKGPYRPPQGVQRGSVVDMPLYPGDPLSPGWGSEKGAKKLDRKDAESLMKIPVLPISYGDAQPLLEHLGGPVAPEAWRGALPITYHIGPGPSKAHLKVDFDWTSKPLYNVIATIPGAESPDEWVIYGNHHDAWNNGALDPVSGAIAVLESARALAELKKQGWQPRRTIKLILWDGEEFGLLGSTEWAEKHAAELQRKAVAYFNSDTNSKGYLGAGGSPGLEKFFAEVMRDVKQPGQDVSVLSHRPKREDKPVPFKMSPLGAGSDYVVFIHHLGIASINAGFGGESMGGIYHSAYDSFDWYTKFSDGDFTHGQALTQVMSTALMRMASAEVLPFEFGAAARSIEEWMKDLPKVDATGLKAEVDALKAASERFESAYAKAVSAAPEKRRAVNAILRASEQALLKGPGIPGRPWYKHQLMAPGLYTGYSAKPLPTIRDTKDPQAGVALVADAVRAYRETIEKATALLN
ncbi:MAG: M28 family peptidase [Bryobacteraceae bacterium]|nr:M28 family peptidase [Bryobacteraceae bacterium]